MFSLLFETQDKICISDIICATKCMLIVIRAVLEPPAPPELAPETDTNPKNKKKKDKNRSKTEDKNDPEENKLKTVREEITNTDKTRKTTPTQPVTGNSHRTHQNITSPSQVHCKTPKLSFSEVNKLKFPQSLTKLMNRVCITQA